jgi:hypothetical protein
MVCNTVQAVRRGDEAVGTRIEKAEMKRPNARRKREG